jgi:arsenate reductase
MLLVSQQPYNFVFTVCDDAAGEVCPVWPGKPITAHWGVPDPAALPGTEAEKRELFLQVALMLQRRIELFINLPMAQLDTMTLQAQLKDIGQHERC